ncbi:MAG: hypothetical protein ABIE75_03585 [Candidatus Omnitrophota bacterium]
MEFPDQKVKCTIFLEAQAVIRRTELKTREPRSFKEKQYYAQDILLEFRALLPCFRYDVNNLDCLNCHSLSVKYMQKYSHLAAAKTKEVVIE